VKKKVLWLSLLGLFGSLAVAEEFRWKQEAELLEVFEKAKSSLPETLRERVGDVELKRATDLGIGPEMPLEYRLLNRAAYASFSIGDRDLTVYDAGALDLPTWAGDPPKKDEVVKLLAGVADVMGVEVPQDGKGPVFLAAWKDFVRRVYSWGDRDFPKVLPAVDDQELWNRFLGDGVWRLMGEKVPMEELMVHELGHALQLESRSMGSRMNYWGELSGFTEIERGEVADGFVGGMNKMEETIVLIRLLMADDPEKMSRGEKADYAAAEGARFVNRYARYDLREDYAESFRLMAYEPERLARIAPEKFLYLNTLGWNARLDLEKPGPLWYSGEEFEKMLPKSVRKDLFERLLGKNGKGPALSSTPLAAILRAHSGVVSADDLPEPYPVIEIPGDLPKGLVNRLDPELLGVEVDGVVHVASPERQRLRQDQLLDEWIERFSFYRDLLRFREKGTKGLRVAYEKDVKENDDMARRLNRYEALRDYGGKSVSAEDWRKWDQAEAKAQHKAGNVWAAARYSILTSEKKTEELFQEITDTAAKGDGGFERARFIGTAVDLALEGKDAKLVKAKIEAIPGKTLGKWLRVKYLLKAAEILNGTSNELFVNAARSEAADCDFPALKQQLEWLLKSE
jgi:hypothetical protein